ncbi:hypothetical protein QAD02_013637 [Eretmocerus hayati]|uniref:Uncharacterized protein n=1 Tax=Eretmocerus hayati TaxID=131215 RepID=A0ACC2P7U5_9HYME|nr:hypothetical protein QAD02_013637 [Eretmocerus hayati]
MPSPHDIARRAKFKKICRERKRARAQRVEEEWKRLRLEENARDAWARSLVRRQDLAAVEAAREEELRQEADRISKIREEERIGRERIAKERAELREQRRSHVEALPQERLRQYESMVLSSKRTVRVRIQNSLFFITGL